MRDPEQRVVASGRPPRARRLLQAHAEPTFMELTSLTSICICIRQSTVVLSGTSTDEGAYVFGFVGPLSLSTSRSDGSVSVSPED